MIPEAPFLFSIAGLSASLAGLAGLVAGLRRGADVRAIDLFRLRQIVEFSFANVLLSLATLPLAIQLGLADAVRVTAALALVYAVGTAVVLIGRMRHAGIHWTPIWWAAVAVINTLILVGALWAIATGSIAALQGLLITLLARPMLAFLLVLASFEE